jgi:hypothetical protein
MNNIPSPLFKTISDVLGVENESTLNKEPAAVADKATFKRNDSIFGNFSIALLLLPKTPIIKNVIPIVIQILAIRFTIVSIVIFDKF